ncbi:hypothetical protein TVAGG3_0432480 [Trichomonas vaginalis G3]|nr:hypothetical protein TVAGG3_0432480 [Trichomonas vaginalis G3]KAI5536853.1 hypothetical protein TVAGG3_0432480 [Trichomonas vaginalis G3]
MNNSSFIYSVFQSICSFTSVADENFKQVKISKSLIESFSYLTDYNIKAYKLLETDENKKKFFVNNFLPNLIEEFAHSQYNDVDNFADVNFGEIFDAVKDEIGKAYTELPSFRNIFPAEYCINLISQTDYSILFDQQIKKPDHKNLYIVKYPVEVIGTNFEEIKKSSKEDKRILDQLEESIYNLQMDMDQYQASLLRNFIHKVIPSEKNKLKTDYNLIRKNILDLFKTGINASIGKIMNTLRSKLITKDDLNSDSWIADFLEFHNDVVASEIPVYYPLLVAIIELKFMKSRENVLNNFKFNAENDPPTTFQPDCPFKNGETKECLENAFTVLSTCLINLNTNADPNKGIKYNDAVFYFDTMYDFIIYKPNPVSHENLKEKKYISTVFQRLFNCRLSFANYLKSFSNLAKDPVEFLRIPKEIEENNRKLADSLSNEF